MAEQTPRIDASYLENFQDRTVRIVGKVTQLRGNQATIDSNGPVTLNLRKDSHLANNHYVEVIGKVKNDLSLMVLGVTDFGLTFDMAAMDLVIDVSHRYKSIFYDN